MGANINISKSRMKPDDFIAQMEISKGTRTKYEVDPETGLLFFDRVLTTSTRYPVNYGYIPNSLSEDGDPADVMILGNEEIMPLTLVRCRPIGYIEMIDGGERDEKILCVPIYKGAPLAHVTDVSEVDPTIIKEITHFLGIYKDLEKGSSVEIRGVHGRDAAIKIVAEAQARHDAQK